MRKIRGRRGILEVDAADAVDSTRCLVPSYYGNKSQRENI